MALDAGPDVCVLLTPHAMGGHEIALFAWLADAVRDAGLRPLIVAPGAALVQACAAAGLTAFCQALPASAGASASRGSRRSVLAALWRWPTHKPLLLAPGVLHASAWLLAAALLLGRRVWVYVPMAYSAAQMGFRAATWRDHALAPWLRRVESFITLDRRQAALLASTWRLTTEVHLLPNPPRPVASRAALPASAAEGRLRIAYVGRLELHQKGLDWLIALLRSRVPWSQQCHWLFQGRGPAESALHALASELGPDHVVVFPHAPIADALAQADVLLLASRFEGQPLVAMEATAHGWPVVATRGSGVADFVPATSLFDFGDAEGLRCVLHTLWTQQARTDAVRQAQQALQAMDLAGAYSHALHGLCHALKSQPMPTAAGPATR